MLKKKALSIQHPVFKNKNSKIVSLYRNVKAKNLTLIYYYTAKLVF